MNKTKLYESIGRGVIANGCGRQLQQQEQRKYDRPRNGLQIEWKGRFERLIIQQSDRLIRL